MGLEEFKAREIRKPKQVELSFEKKHVQWHGYVGTGQRDRSGDEIECHWTYDDGKCMRDGEAATFDDLVSAIGPNMMFYKNDRVFQGILESEERKKLKN